MFWVVKALFGLLFVKKKPRSRGVSSHPLYPTWYYIHKRCYDSSYKKYRWYGGRGIRVAKRWHVFENFLADMGPRPTKTHTVDRINVNGNYSPRNCRWATPTQQARNKTNNVITIKEARKIQRLARKGLRPIEISDVTGIRYDIVYRVAKGLSWS